MVRSAPSSTLTSTDEAVSESTGRAILALVCEIFCISNAVGNVMNSVWSRLVPVRSRLATRSKS